VSEGAKGRKGEWAKVPTEFGEQVRVSPQKPLVGQPSIGLAVREASPVSPFRPLALSPTLLLLRPRDARLLGSHASDVRCAGETEPIDCP
jgi:hypothetical protein